MTQEGAVVWSSGWVEHLNFNPLSHSPFGIIRKPGLNRRRALIDIYKREDSGHLPGKVGVAGPLPIVTLEKQQSETSTKCPKAGLRPEPKSMC